jgi:hypothetical protein
MPDGRDSDEDGCRRGEIYNTERLSEGLDRLQASLAYWTTHAPPEMRMNGNGSKRRCRRQNEAGNHPTNLTKCPLGSGFEGKRS